MGKEGGHRTRGGSSPRGCRKENLFSRPLRKIAACSSEPGKKEILSFRVFP